MHRAGRHGRKLVPVPRWHRDPSAPAAALPRRRSTRVCPFTSSGGNYGLPIVPPRISRRFYSGQPDVVVEAKPPALPTAVNARQQIWCPDSREGARLLDRWHRTRPAVKPSTHPPRYQVARGGQSSPQPPPLEPQLGMTVCHEHDRVAARRLAPDVHVLPLGPVMVDHSYNNCHAGCPRHISGPAVTVAVPSRLEANPRNSGCMAETTPAHLPAHPVRRCRSTASDLSPARSRRLWRVPSWTVREAGIA